MKEDCKYLLGIIQTSMHKFIENKNNNIQIQSNNSTNWNDTAF